MPPKRNLLLCFDAFGTLFRPKSPIETQYGEVARQCLSGPHAALLGDDGDAAIRTAFRAAFRAQAQQHPNYGRASHLGAAQWWTRVIYDTFAPLLAPAGVAVPAELAPRLLHRFASRDGYALVGGGGLPGALRALKEEAVSSPARVHLSKKKTALRFRRLVVGVITNSDDRVPAILASFGIRVAPLRYGGQGQPSSEPADIDFTCLSYDVGVEKPDTRIFRAAEALLAEVVAVRGQGTDDTDDTDDTDGPEHWDKMYVGDDVAKDVVGAQNAGWLPVLVAGDEETQTEVTGMRRLADLSDDDDDDNDDGRKPLADLFAPQGNVTALQVPSAEALVEWLAGR